MKLDWDDLVAKCSAYNSFVRDVNTNNRAQSYLLIGQDELLKSKVLEKMLKMLFCKSDKRPCNDCVECSKVENRNNLDIMYFGNEQSCLKDDIDRLRNECFIRPLINDLKVLVVPFADKIEEQMQNKLLKTLEELPDSIMVIMAVSDEEQVLPTIRSRMRKLYMGNLSNDVLNDILKDNAQRDEIIVCSNGYLKDIQSLINDKHFTEYYDFATSLLNEFPSSRELGDKAKFFIEHKNNIAEILKILMYVMYDNMKNNKTIYPTLALPKCIREVAKGIDALSKYANVNAVLDKVLLTILEEKSKC